MTKGEKTLVLGIDPGKTIGMCALSQFGIRAEEYGSDDSTLTLLRLSVEELRASGWDITVVIEGIVPYAQPLDAAVIATCYQIGQLQYALRDLATVKMISRKEVKSHLLGKTTGSDVDVKRALIDALGEPGTKANPGPTYGVKGHGWAALAVAYVASCQLQGDKGEGRNFAVEFQPERSGSADR